MPPAGCRLPALGAAVRVRCRLPWFAVSFLPLRPFLDALPLRTHYAHTHSARLPFTLRCRFCLVRLVDVSWDAFHTEPYLTAVRRYLRLVEPRVYLCRTVTLPALPEHGHRHVSPACRLRLAAAFPLLNNSALLPFCLHLRLPAVLLPPFATVADTLPIPAVCSFQRLAPFAGTYRCVSAVTVCRSFLFCWSVLPFNVHRSADYVLLPFLVLRFLAEHSYLACRLVSAVVPCAGTCCVLGPCLPTFSLTTTALACVPALRACTVRCARRRSVLGLTVLSPARCTPGFCRWYGYPFTFPLKATVVPRRACRLRNACYRGTPAAVATAWFCSFFFGLFR